MLLHKGIALLKEWTIRGAACSYVRMCLWTGRRAGWTLDSCCVMCQYEKIKNIESFFLFLSLPSKLFLTSRFFLVFAGANGQGPKC